MIDQKQFYLDAQHAKVVGLKSIRTELSKRAIPVFGWIFFIYCLTTIVLLFIYGFTSEFIESAKMFLQAFLIVGIIMAFYFLVILSPFWIFQLRRLNRYKSDYFEISRILGGGQPFALYLRDFASANKYYACINPYSESKDQVVYNGSLKFRKVSKIVSKYLPVIFLNNVRDITDRFYGHTFYTSNNSWEAAMNLLALKAKFIVLDLSGEKLTENLIIEIKFILKHKIPIVLTCPESTRNQLLSDYPGLETQISAKALTRYINHSGVILPVEDLIETHQLVQFLKN